MVLEYLDKILSVKIVSGVDEAVKHINNYSSGHTESIITESEKTFEKFYNKIDSAIILKMHLHNLLMEVNLVLEQKLEYRLIKFM